MKVSSLEFFKKTIKPDNYFVLAKEVIKWNRIIGGDNYLFDNKKTLKLQERLVIEEAKEMMEEIRLNNKKGYVKELVDLFVVSSYGTFLQGYDGYTTTAENFVHKVSSPKGIPSLLEIEDKILNNNTTSSIYYQWAVNALNVVNANIVDIFYEVMRSNFSKIPLQEVFLKEAKKKHGKKADCASIEQLIYLEQERMELEFRGRYSGITGKQVTYKEENYIVFTDSNGKVLKPCTFVEADLNKLF